MSFTGNENHAIPLPDAATLTKNYREAQQAGDRYSSITAEYFGKQAIFDILNQENCVGIRAYFGVDTSGNTPCQCLVICGVGSNGNDLYNGALAENGTHCPPICSSANPLNS